MPDTLAFELVKVIGSAVGLVTGIFVTYWQIRQHTKAKSLRLVGNPERCGRHEEAIKTLKDDVRLLDGSNANDHSRMFDELKALSVEVVRLGRNGGGGK